VKSTWKADFTYFPSAENTQNEVRFSVDEREAMGRALILLAWEPTGSLPAVSGLAALHRLPPILISKLNLIGLKPNEVKLGIWRD